MRTSAKFLALKPGCLILAAAPPLPLPTPPAPAIAACMSRSWAIRRLMELRILRKTILVLAVGAVIGRSLAASEAQKRADEVSDYLETYRAGAQAGVPEDQYNLGASYRWGVGTERNLILATQWIRKAAEAGYPLAERTIGEMYEQGEGLPANLMEAMRWYRRAALHGDSAAPKDIAALEAKMHPVTPGE